MHPVLEMTIQPLHHRVRRAVHLQGEIVAILDLAHVPFGRYRDPMSSWFVVRVRVHNVSGRSFLG